MKRTVLAEHVVDLQANLLAALFNDGSIELYVDEQPDDGPDLDFLPRSPIGVFKLGSPAFSKGNDGKIILYPPRRRSSWPREGSNGPGPFLLRGTP
jgi:hypothetical protein